MEQRLGGVYFAILAIVLHTTFVESKQIPDYIHVCKRDPDTVEECVAKNIADLREKLIDGIPELRVPPIEPLNIPEIVIDQGTVVRFKAVGKDVAMRGASNYKLKSVSVDLDTLIMKATIFFPKLNFDGKYDLDARLLLVPIHGRGNIRIGATDCDADIVLYGRLEKKNGEDYLKFSSVTADINVQDYTLEITNLFNGDVQLGDLINQILNQNKAQYFRTAKPYIERTVSNLVKRIANRIAGSFRYDDIIPNP